MEKMCRDCHVTVAVWYAHEPEDCCDIGCDCEPQCSECMRYHLHLLKMLAFSKN